MLFHNQQYLSIVSSSIYWYGTRVGVEVIVGVTPGTHVGVVVRVGVSVGVLVGVREVAVLVGQTRSCKRCPPNMVHPLT